MKQLINLTGHEINFRLTNGLIITIFPEENAARVSEHVARVKDIELSRGFLPLWTRVYGGVDLPNPQKNVLYIVSSVVKANVHRSDLITPFNLEFISGIGKVANGVAK